MALRCVIVGAGPAGLNALKTLGELAPDARLTLIGDELPYSRMVLPYYLIGNIEEPALATGDDAWFAARGVETRFGRRVVAIDVDAHHVELDDGSKVGYDRLLLATGSRPARPPIEGADGPGVRSLWTLDDAKAFLGAPRGKTAIVGAGFIAFTILDAIAERSDGVCLVEIEPQILPHMLDPSAARLLEAHLLEAGIEVHKGDALERIEDAGPQRRLRFSSGDTVECGAVLLATGVRPNLDFLAGSGIEVREGVVVDSHLRTSAPDVYAAGDVAQGPDLLGGEPRIQAIQPTAVDHGRVAAANMAGLDAVYPGSLTMNILAAQGLEACSFGRWERDRDVTTLENHRNRIYRKYVWQDDVMVGGILVGPSVAVSSQGDVGMLKGLIQTGVALGPWRAYLEENPLDLRRVFVASGAAPKLLESMLLPGRKSLGGGFRTPELGPSRPRSPHHATFFAGGSGS